MEYMIEVPDVGEGVEEVEISEWYVAEGDTVAKGQPVAELLAEKASINLESECAGTVAKILQPEGAVVEIGQAVAVLDGA